MQTWPLHKLESVTDDEIRDATSIAAVVLSNDAMIPIIPREQGDESTPLCIVVETPDGVNEVREHVAKVLCEAFRRQMSSRIVGSPNGKS